MVTNLPLPNEESVQVGPFVSARKSGGPIVRKVSSKGANEMDGDMARDGSFKLRLLYLFVGWMMRWIA